MERLVEVRQVGTSGPPVQEDRARPSAPEQAAVESAETRAIPAQADAATVVGEGATPEDAATPDGMNAVVSETKSDSEITVDGKAVADGRAIANGKATADSQETLAPTPHESAKTAAIDDTRPAADGARDGALADGDQAGEGGRGSADNPYYLAEVGFWDRVVELEELWQGHAARWPDGPKSPGGDRVRVDDPPGSWRGDGDRYLGPQDNAEAGRLIAGLREPEEAVTGLLREIEQDNEFGGHLVGLDHRLKGDERLKEKIVDALENEVGASLADATSEIHDAVRYTLCFDKEMYADGYRDVHQRLVSAGCQMPYRLNHWLENPQYKGINSRWQTPDGGRFELQFHTKESFYAKEHLTHRSYERLRSPETSWEEAPDLEAYQVAVSAAIPKPAGVADIPSIRRYG